MMVRLKGNGILENNLVHLSMDGILTPSFFASINLYSKLSHFNLNYPIAADFDLMFRFIEVDNNSPLIINRPLVNMKLGGESNKSFRNIFKGNAEIRKSLNAGNINVSYIYTLRRLFFKYLQKFI